MPTLRWMTATSAGCVPEPGWRASGERPERPGRHRFRTALPEFRPSKIVKKERGKKRLAPCVDINVVCREKDLELIRRKEAMEKSRFFLEPILGYRNRSRRRSSEARKGVCVHTHLRNLARAVIDDLAGCNVHFTLGRLCLYGNRPKRRTTRWANCIASRPPSLAVARFPHQGLSLKPTSRKADAY